MPMYGFDVPRLVGCGLGPGHGRGDRDGQVYGHDRRHRPAVLLLQARELRAVHAMPGGAEAVLVNFEVIIPTHSRKC